MPENQKVPLLQKELPQRAIPKDVEIDVEEQINVTKSIM